MCLVNLRHAQLHLRGQLVLTENTFKIPLIAPWLWILRMHPGQLSCRLFSIAVQEDLMVAASPPAVSQFGS